MSVMTQMAPFERFYSVIRTIPAGCVCTYGRIAELAGMPRRARLVGHALKVLPDGSEVPWWRVLNSQGRISARGLGGSDEYQRLLLEEEGVAFDASGRVDFRRHGWPRQD